MSHDITNDMHPNEFTSTVLKHIRPLNVMHLNDVAAWNRRMTMVCEDLPWKATMSVLFNQSTQSFSNTAGEINCWARDTLLLIILSLVCGSDLKEAQCELSKPLFW